MLRHIKLAGRKILLVAFVSAFPFSQSQAKLSLDQVDIFCFEHVHKGRTCVFTAEGKIIAVKFGKDEPIWVK